MVIQQDVRPCLNFSFGGAAENRVQTGLIRFMRCRCRPEAHALCRDTLDDAGIPIVMTRSPGVESLDSRKPTDKRLKKNPVTFPWKGDVLKL